MNFYVDSGGNVFAVDPEKVYQGQAYASTIRMIGAFASNLAVTVGFTLPNGFIISPRLMTNVNDLSEKLEGFGVWEYTLPFTVTEYAGKVGVQFYVHGSRTRTVLVKNDAGTYEPVNEDVATVIATGESSFNVEKGVPIYLPDKDEIPDYDNLLVQILAALSALQERYNLTNLENGEGDGSVQQKGFEDTAGGTAYANGSFAQGVGTVAGSKAFNITKYNAGGSNMTLDSVEGLAVGMVCSCQFSNNFDFFGKIGFIATDIKTVVFDTYPELQDQDKSGTDRKMLLWVPEHPELGTTIIGTGANASGYETKANQVGASAEGYNTIAGGKYSHSEGKGTKAGYAAHSEGQDTQALSLRSHAEGLETLASGDGAHAEGYKTKATAQYTHAQNNSTEANGDNSSSAGYETRSNHANQFVVGQWNENKEDTLFEVGNGTSDGNRSNAFEVLKDGRAKVQTAPSAATDVVRLKELNEAISKVNQMSFKVVSVLPDKGESTIIYLLNVNGESPNIYEEWIYTNNAWEKIGTTDIDLSNYVTLDTDQDITGAKLFNTLSANDIYAGHFYAANMFGQTYYSTHISHTSGWGLTYTYTFPEKSGTLATTDDFDNYVTLNSEQRITGQKWFDQPIHVDSGNSEKYAYFYQLGTQIVDIDTGETTHYANGYIELMHGYGSYDNIFQLPKSELGWSIETLATQEWVSENAFPMVPIPTNYLSNYIYIKRDGSVGFTPSTTSGYVNHIAVWGSASIGSTAPSTCHLVTSIPVQPYQTANKIYVDEAIKKLYRHSISVHNGGSNNDQGDLYFTIRSTRAEAYTSLEELLNAPFDNVIFKHDGPANVGLYITNGIMSYLEDNSYGMPCFQIELLSLSATSFYENIFLFNAFYFGTDTVKEL